jgi:hypothetical protein
MQNKRTNIQRVCIKLYVFISLKSLNKLTVKRVQMDKKYVDDAIGVNRQKEFRKAGYEKLLQRVQTDVIEVQRPPQDLPQTRLKTLVLKQFDSITTDYGVAGWTIETALCCWFCATYGHPRLPIVAITDGAKNIRLHLWRVFGKQVIIIFDWYLNKKIWTLMSMIAPNKEQKEKAAREIVGLLWEGLTDDAIAHIRLQDIHLIRFLIIHKFTPSTFFIPHFLAYFCRLIRPIFLLIRYCITEFSP